MKLNVHSYESLGTFDGPGQSRSNSPEKWPNPLGYSVDALATDLQA